MSEFVPSHNLDPGTMAIIRITAQEVIRQHRSECCIDRIEKEVMGDPISPIPSGLRSIVQAMQQEMRNRQESADRKQSWMREIVAPLIVSAVTSVTTWIVAYLVMKPS